MKLRFRCMHDARSLVATLLLAMWLSLVGCGGDSSSGSTSNPPPQPNPPADNVPDVEQDEEQDQEQDPPLTQLSPDTQPDPALPARGSPEWDQAKEAARFLTQTTFGPTAKTITALMAQGQDAWLEEQFAKPLTPKLAHLDARYIELGWDPTPDPERDEDGWVRDLQRSDVWWEIVLRGDDQLRQRVAFALSQIFVISNVSDVLFNDSRGIASYHDMLASHAFGNYRDLLEDVTLHPMMGEYLSMVRNRKADEAQNIRPDENYAREVMQLFSIGLVELNLDGTVITDEEGEPIPTYDQDIIKDFARVFTGWNFATANHWWEWTSDAVGEALPMKAFQEVHDKGEKTLLNGQIIPAGQTAEQDMAQAMDNLFYHDNVGPFIGKQLIQRLITSNPSPGYVERVARVFNDNGQDVRGDMRAVIKAIVTDDEARSGHLDNPDTFGKLREPILQFSHFWRVFKARGVIVQDAQGNDTDWRIRFRGSDRTAGQRPYGSFSVFNFYQPGYSHPGAISQANMLAPEFQIHTESVMIAKTNQLTGNSAAWLDLDLDHDQPPRAQEDWDIYPPLLHMREEKALAGDPRALIDRLDLLLTGGQLSAEARQALEDYIATLPAPDGGHWSSAVRVTEAAALIIASPYFALQR
ncbi:DUF1800 family protein [Marinimicrobium sp. ABcell2]|uniref:DUF1800 domain-containing protein n=1 Tax=Marinimicrobium sp. ABcell2 TaxID=3069751 RepID=UPI0027B43E2D|nr:DUF1800 domain-containing protein [Marinimicrobium sp. ABcell2]MDQ2077742.1 DUF1800 domain-containing protein [Marinimicrobium sp. ABcell2]